jgi:hypothetical protein
MTRYLTDEELEKLARRIWYGRCTSLSGISRYEDWHGRLTHKIADMRSVGIDGWRTEFQAPLGGRRVGEWIVDVQYPKWEFMGTISVRRVR